MKNLMDVLYSCVSYQIYHATNKLTIKSGMVLYKNI